MTRIVGIYRNELQINSKPLYVYTFISVCLYMFLINRSGSYHGKTRTTSLSLSLSMWVPRRDLHYGLLYRLLGKFDEKQQNLRDPNGHPWTSCRFSGTVVVPFRPLVLASAMNHLGTKRRLSCAV